MMHSLRNRCNCLRSFCDKLFAAIQQRSMNGARAMARGSTPPTGTSSTRRRWGHSSSPGNKFFDLADPCAGGFLAETDKVITFLQVVGPDMRDLRLDDNVGIVMLRSG